MTAALNTDMTPEEILQQIAQINQMLEGSISPYASNDAHRTYHNLSSYVGGKSTKHVREDQIPALQHLINEHKRFRDLVEKYELAVIRQTRAELGLPMQSVEAQPETPAQPSAASNSPDAANTSGALRPDGSAA